MNQATVYTLGRQTLLLMRFLGYSFVLFFLIDTASLLIPLRFTNAVWEFETIGQIIERLPIILMAPILIFFGEETHRFRWEFIVLKVLNWTMFLFAILMFLAAPLFIVNSFRVQEIRHSEAISRSTQQNEPLRQISERLNLAKTDDEIRNVLKLLPVQGNQRPNLSRPQEQRQRILEQIEKSQQQIKEQLENDKKFQSRAIWRNGLKWASVALISGGLVAYFWQLTRWARLNILLDSSSHEYDGEVIVQPGILGLSGNELIDYGADAPPDLPVTPLITSNNQLIDYGADAPIEANPSLQSPESNPEK
ncbi:MAG: HpsJ family protein [Pseudanabaenaceae cyanobacterium]|jgi:hypothetical protein